MGQSAAAGGNTGYLKLTPTLPSLQFLPGFSSPQSSQLTVSLHLSCVAILSVSHLLSLRSLNVQIFLRSWEKSGLKQVCRSLFV